MNFVNFSFVNLFVIFVTTAHIAYAGPCDDQTGEAYGLCLAAEAIPCTLFNENDPLCEAMTKDFISRTGVEPPWLNYIETVCPCLEEINRVIDSVKVTLGTFVGECRIGQLTERVPVIDSNGILLTGNFSNTSGGVLIGAYSYTDTIPGSGQCEVDASFEPLGHIFTAHIINKPEQQACSDAIEKMTLSIGINCLKL